MTHRPHVVEVICTCPDPDQCTTNDLVANRNTGGKEYFRVLGLLEQAMARVCGSQEQQT
jgi:hypothetical protein